MAQQVLTYNNGKKVFAPSCISLAESFVENPVGFEPPTEEPKTEEMKINNEGDLLSTLKGVEGKAGDEEATGRREHQSSIAAPNLSLKGHIHSSVFVQGAFANKETKLLFADRGYKIVNRIEDSDIVVFTGGADVSPLVYGEEPIPGVWSDTLRDKEDIAAVREAQGKFLVGICRGAQLLNCIPNHGALWQDVDRHGSSPHLITDKITGETLTVNSLHHQMVRITPKAELVAYATIATHKECEDRVWKRRSDHFDENNFDPEVVWYPETRSLLIQSHPEFERRGPTGNYFHTLMNRYYHAA